MVNIAGNCSTTQVSFFLKISWDFFFIELIPFHIRFLTVHPNLETLAIETRHG